MPEPDHKTCKTLMIVGGSHFGLVSFVTTLN